MAEHDAQACEVLARALRYHALWQGWVDTDESVADLLLTALAEAKPPLVVVDADAWERLTGPRCPNCGCPEVPGEVHVAETLGRCLLRDSGPTDAPDPRLCDCPPAGHWTGCPQEAADGE